jgi:hypothetical protein
MTRRWMLRGDGTADHQTHCFPCKGHIPCGTSECAERRTDGRKQRGVRAGRNEVRASDATRKAVLVRAADGYRRFGLLAADELRQARVARAGLDAARRHRHRAWLGDQDEQVRGARQRGVDQIPGQHHVVAA